MAARFTLAACVRISTLHLLGRGRRRFPGKIIRESNPSNQSTLFDHMHIRAGEQNSVECCTELQGLDNEHLNSGPEERLESGTSFYLSPGEEKEKIQVLSFLSADPDLKVEMHMISGDDQDSGFRSSCIRTLGPTRETEMGLGCRVSGGWGLFVFRMKRFSVGGRGLKLFARSTFPKRSGVAQFEWVRLAWTGPPRQSGTVCNKKAGFCLYSHELEATSLVLCFCMA